MVLFSVDFLRQAARGFKGSVGLSEVGSMKFFATRLEITSTRLEHPECSVFKSK